MLWFGCHDCCRVAFRLDHYETLKRLSDGTSRLPLVVDLESSSRTGGPLSFQRKSRSDSRNRRDKPLWGAPGIHGELLKLRSRFVKLRLPKYMVRHPSH